MARTPIVAAGVPLLATARLYLAVSALITAALWLLLALSPLPPACGQGGGADPCEDKRAYERAAQQAKQAQEAHQRHRLSRVLRTEEDAQRGLKNADADIKRYERMLLPQHKPDPERIADAKEQIKTRKAIKASIYAWLQSLRKVEVAQRREKALLPSYVRAREAKDNVLSGAKQTFTAEQARIQRTRSGLEARPRDEAYYQQVGQMLVRTRATYERILIGLVRFDCFTDVRTFMDDIKGRMKNVDTAIAQLEKQRTGAGTGKDSQAAADTLTGAWNVTITNSYATYEYQWDIVPAGAGKWTAQQTLLDTTHSHHRALIGKRGHDYTLTATGTGAFKLYGASSDSNPGDPGYFVQEGTGTFTRDTLSGSATHKGGRITDTFRFTGQRKR